MTPYLGTMALVFTATLGVALGLTPLVRWAALRLGLVDRPGEERRVHKIPVPRLGGLAMYAAFAVGIFIMLAAGVQNGQTGNGRFEASRILVTLLGAGLITLVMAVDDIRGLRPVPRLLWQIGAALLVILPALIWPGTANLNTNPPEPASTLHYDQGAGVLALSVQNPFGGVIVLPLALAMLFTVVWIVGMTNTVNWIDGLDGLAGGVSLVACVVLFVITGPVLHQYTLAYLPLILGAAILGFLPYNIHPARIFMGDSGAMFLGFTLAVLSIIGGAKLAAALLVLGVPILDGIYMVIYRLYRGRSPMSSDRGHLHHRLLDIGLSQQQVVFVFYILCSVFGVLGLLPSDAGQFLGVPGSAFRVLKFAALMLMALVLVALMVYIARRQFDRAGDRGQRGESGNP